MNVLCCVDHVMRTQTAPTLKVAMNVNAKKDSRVMDTPTAQVVIMYQKQKRHQANHAPNWAMEAA